MDKNSKIYIAGHRGLVGSAIHRKLVSLGYTNFVLKTSKELDLRDQAATNKFFAEEKPEYVFLAAAKVGGINANNIYRADFIYDNIAIQNNVVKASFDTGVKKLLFLGSVCIYPKVTQLPIAEESLLTGELEYTNEPYALAKIAGIKLVESFNLQHGTNYVSVMPANLYGYNDNFDLEKSHVIPALIRKISLCKLIEQGEFKAAAKNLGINFQSEEKLLAKLAQYGIEKIAGKVVLSVWGTGIAYREFLHADDMAAACIYIMNEVNFKDLTTDMKEIRNTHINIGTGTDISIANLVRIIQEIIGFNGKIKFDSSKPDGTIRRTMSVEKLNRLGWKHSIQLEDGLKQIIEWYEESYISA